MSLDEDPYLYILSRSTKSILEKLALCHHSISVESIICMRLWLRRFLLLRDEAGVILVDLERSQSKRIISSVSRLAPYPQYQLEIINKSEIEAGLMQLLLIEYDGRISTLKRFEMNEQFLKTGFEMDFDCI